MVTQQEIKFDQDDFEQAAAREAENGKRALGPTSSRRIGGNEKAAPVPQRSNDQVHQDRAIVRQGQARQMAFATKEDAVRAVQTAFAYGKLNLSSAEIFAISLVAFQMGLDPSPGVGHMYVWRDRGLVIAIGYQGYLHKAKQQHEFFIQAKRPMTSEERVAHGLADGDVGGVCELIDMRSARMAKELDLPIPVITGIGIWKLESYHKDNEWKSDTIPNTKTPLWVALKNALKDALRQLGVGFAPTTQEVEGFHYDAGQDGFVQDGGAVEEVIEGDVSEEGAGE